LKAVILSYAQDTNGQNERFVRAARKHGKDVLKALAIGNDDPAGVVGRYRIAADKMGGLSIRSVARTVHYFDWPTDIEWTRSNEPLIRELVDQADVIHLNNSYRAAQRFHARKPMLLHHHGSMFRNNTEHMMKTAYQRRWVQAVSTIDLTKPDPEVLHWLPTAYDVADLVKFGQKHRRKPDGRIRIVHCPTNRELKSTATLIAAVDELRAEGLPLDLVIVEGRRWVETMGEKAKADIVFDQTMFGYGCNGVEAWAMGIPVIAGADEATLYAMRRRFYPHPLPFYQATDATIIDAIRALATSADLRAEYGERGHEHVLRWHDERPALAKLAELYALTMQTFHAKAPTASEAVRFRTRRTVRIDDVTFPKGDIETDDPDVINRLRHFAQKRPLFGVEELAG
jgi:hypothetical protein